MLDDKGQFIKYIKQYQKAGTKRADEIHDYYLKLEEILHEVILHEVILHEVILHEVIEEESNELKLQQINKSHQRRSHTIIYKICGV
jgi:hypothetical protein